jgi:hypothetical protein
MTGEHLKSNFISYLLGGYVFLWKNNSLRSDYRLGWRDLYEDPYVLLDNKMGRRLVPRLGDWWRI